MESATTTASDTDPAHPDLSTGLKQPGVSPRELDDSLYKMEEQALEFFRAQTGIEDADELKRHVLAVQADAYAVHPYPCIRRFSFIMLKLARLPAYPRLLALGKERPGAILLDIGCCFGNDIRKAVADGFPVEGALASDLHPEFWALGHKLFKSTPESFPVPFIAGDAFDPAMLALAPPLPRAPDGTSSPSDPAPALAGLTSLNPLRGHLSAIHASSFFHLFPEARQLHLARLLAGLLSPQPGSLILGAHGGRPEKGLRTEAFRPNSHGVTMFCHSPESWKALWEEEVFAPGEVAVEAKLVEVQREDLGVVWLKEKFYLLVWSVTRL